MSIEFWVALAATLTFSSIYLVREWWCWGGRGSLATWRARRKAERRAKSARYLAGELERGRTWR